jgi:hypothetical protein
LKLSTVVPYERYLKLSALQSTITGYHNDNDIVKRTEGKINNEYGISNFFSPKGDGMLPGDIVWDFIKKTGRKLEYEEGHVIGKGAEGFQCKDCKYYMYANRCQLIKGTAFMPEMSCAFVVKIDSGTEV